MDKKPNYFVRLLIIGFILFLTYLVFISFTKSEPSFNLSAGIITVLLLITVLILSEAFDNLSLGKLLSLSKEVESKNEEVIKTKKENTDLRENLIRLSAIFSQLQTQNMTNNNMLFTPDTLRMMLGVEKAQEKEQDDDIVADKKDEQINGESSSIHSWSSSNPRKSVDFRMLEDIAINKYIEKHSIPMFEMLRDVQFASSFENIDPIMDRRIVFDGYYKSQNVENFVEVKRTLSPMMYDRLYVQLAKIMFYGQAKKIEAYLTLLIVDIPEAYEQYSQHRYSKERIFEIFQPAIANNLLRIEFVSITESDIENEAVKEVAVSESRE